ncbi:MAG: hypothetical protein JJE30_06010 [Desulfuromonadales bacterium]|nr:hypothetical protein [Desulfuromonadales bacterium]
MTRQDLMKRFRDTVDELGQSEVARRIGKSSSAVNQVYHGTYQAEPSVLLRRFEEEFCGTTIKCPEMGEISLKRCSDERGTPLSASSPRRIRMHKACKECGGKP